MTPKEKAIELYNKFYGQTPTRRDELQIEEDKRFAKQCALIAVDEILKTLNDDDLYIQGENNIEGFVNYWQEVKQEIEKL